MRPPARTRIAFIASLVVAGIAVAAPASEALLRGKAQLRADQLDAAVETLEAVVKQEPDNAEAHNLLGSAYGRQALVAGLFGKMKLAGKMKDELELAVALAPDDLLYRESLIQYYANAPAIAGGGINKAKAQAAEIGKRDAVRGYLADAMVARIAKKPDEALAALRKASAARPDDVEIAQGVGLQLQQLELWDEAFAHFESFTAKSPGTMTAWYQYGRTAVLANSHHAQGEAALKRDLSHKPTSFEPPIAAAHWRLGMLYEQMKRPADAKSAYRAALALDPAHKESKAALKKLGD